MRITTRYIASNITSTTLLVVFVIMGMQFFISLVGEFRMLGQGDYGLFQAITYSLLDLPHKLYNLFPLAGLIGSLLGLGLMASNSELIVLRAAGHSNGSIVLDVMKVALAMILVAILIGEFIGPYAERYANTLKAIHESGGQALLTKEGTWIREGQNFIHIQAVLPGKHLEGITRYKFDGNNHLKTASYSEFADYRDHHWLLRNVSESYFKDNKVIAKEYKQKEMTIKVKPSLYTLIEVQPEEMTLRNLFKYILYRKKQNLWVGEYELEFWKRLFIPFSSGVMIFLAIPFIFGPLQFMTMGKRILIGTIVGFCFHILNESFGPIGLVFHIAPALAAALPALLFLLVGFLLLQKSK